MAKTMEQFLEDLPEAPSSEVDGPEQPEAKPAPKVESAAAQPKQPAQSSGESATPAAKKTGTPTADVGGDDADPAALTAAVKKALADGDIDSLADLVGDDPTLYHKGSRKWAAARRVAAEQKRENDRVAKQAEQVVTRWKPIADDVAAVNAGDYRRLPGLIQKLTGQDFDSLVLKTARARQGEDPTVPALKAKVAELEARVGDGSVDTSAADRAYHDIIAADLAEDHQVRGLKGWQKKVGAVLKESMDPDLGEPRLNVKQAADRVLRKERAAYEARAKVFAGGEAAKKPAPARSSIERPSLRGSAKVGKIDREQFFADVAKRPL